VRILLWTALASAVCHILLGPTGHGLLGASGIAFALIRWSFPREFNSP
jgi:hypothetical protein